MKAMERYPYLNTKLVELDGDFYIVQNGQSFESDKYVKAFCRQIDKLGIEYTASEVSRLSHQRILS